MISVVTSRQQRTKSNTVGTFRIIYPRLPSTLSLLVSIAVIGSNLPSRIDVKLVYGDRKINVGFGYFLLSGAYSTFRQVPFQRARYVNSGSGRFTAGRMSNNKSPSHRCAMSRYLAS